MLIMVTGAKGLLGQEILRRLRTLGIPCTGVGREDFDVTDPEAVYSAVNREAPDVIIHCAGYTAVDQAETEPAAAGPTPWAACTWPARPCPCTPNSA